MPTLALLAPIWEKAPLHPETMLTWPADYVFRMLWYLQTGKEMAQELAEQQNSSEYS